MANVIRRLIAFLTLAVALTACQLDVTVDVVVDPDGTGQIAVTIVADQEILDQIPTLADDLVLNDVIKAGWSIDGPRSPGDGSGGLFLQMTHPFRSQGEATNLLQSLGPPFTQMEVGRGLNGDVTTNQLRGRLVLVDGFDAFADADLVAAVGSQPFAAQIAAAGATPEENMSVTVRASLPGVLESDTTNVEPNQAGILEWAVPLDGTATPSGKLKPRSNPARVSVGHARCRSLHSSLSLAGSHSWGCSSSTWPSPAPDELAPTSIATLAAF